MKKEAVSKLKAASFYYSSLMLFINNKINKIGKSRAYIFSLLRSFLYLYISTAVLIKNATIKRMILNSTIVFNLNPIHDLLFSCIHLL